MYFKAFDELFFHRLPIRYPNTQDLKYNKYRIIHDKTNRTEECFKILPNG